MLRPLFSSEAGSSEAASRPPNALVSRFDQLEFERHALDNGLQIVLYHDARLPLVAINLWYHVGSKNEAPGRTGFAHLFEHLLFQGSENVGTNDHFRYVQQAGGIANGSTWFDRTNYFEVLPSSHLELGLWLESDRMGHFLPSITQEKLDNQREVVINERRQKIDNQPYGLAFERQHEILHAPDHPYRWPVIGYLDDLEQANLDDVRSFFHRFYAPNNAVLTVAGDFDRSQVLDQVAKYFGDIPPTEPVERPFVPPRPTPHPGGRATLGDNVRLPRIYMSFKGPACGTPEWYAADLLSTALSEGKSSVMYEDLVYRRQLAQDLSCYILPLEETGTFGFVSTAKPGVDILELEKALVEHLDRLVAETLSDERVEQGRSVVLASHYGDLQTLEKRADYLSMGATFFDDPGRMFDKGRYCREIGAEDIRELVRGYFRPEERVVVNVVPHDQVDRVQESPAP